MRRTLGLQAQYGALRSEKVRSASGNGLVRYGPVGPGAARFRAVDGLEAHAFFPGRAVRLHGDRYQREREVAFPDYGRHTLRMILKTGWPENRSRVSHQVRWVAVTDPRPPPGRPAIQMVFLACRTNTGTPAHALGSPRMRHRCFFTAL